MEWYLLLSHGQVLKDNRAIVLMHHQMQVLRISLLVHLLWDNNNNNNTPFKLKEKVFGMIIAMAILEISISALVMKEKKKKKMILRRMFKTQKILRDMCSNTNQRS